MTQAADPSDNWPMPQRRCTESGRTRRVGVELEMAHPDIEVLVGAVLARFGGEAVALTRYEYEISGTASGTWKVELDWAFLREWASAERTPAQPLDDLVALTEDLLRRGSEQFVPYEVVSPPLPMTELASVDGLIASLRTRDARGTTHGLQYAFGMQLNIELPDLGADTITAYLKAFACLHDWLRKRARVDLTRRLTAFAHPFPIEYVRSVIAPAYRPGRERLIADYLAANPTRNRALDLLPLFRHLAPETVTRHVPDPRVKARPALHYRLPDCRIDLPNWGLRPTWEDWLEVEALAADADALEQLCRLYSEYLDDPLAGVLTGGWHERVDNWLRQWRAR